MTVEIEKRITSVHKKFKKCFSSIQKWTTLSSHALSETYFGGAADYDPISADSFLTELCQLSESDFYQIYYLDIDNGIVVKVLKMSAFENPDESELIYFDREEVYNGIVEGSCFIRDNKNLWCIFYDAMEDLLLLHLENKDCINDLSDFLLLK